MRQYFTLYCTKIPIKWIFKDFHLEEVVNMILEVELHMLRNVDYAYVPKIKHLLQTVAEKEIAFKD